MERYGLKREELAWNAGKAQFFNGPHEIKVAAIKEMPLSRIMSRQVHGNHLRHEDTRI